MVRKGEAEEVQEFRAAASTEDPPLLHIITSPSSILTSSHNHCSRVAINSDGCSQGFELRSLHEFKHEFARAESTDDRTEMDDLE